MAYSFFFLFLVTALHGPEGGLAKEGQYELGLLEAATIPEGSDLQDSNLCPDS